MMPPRYSGRVRDRLNFGNYHSVEASYFFHVEVVDPFVSDQIHIGNCSAEATAFCDGVFTEIKVYDMRDIGRRRPLTVRAKGHQQKNPCAFFSHRFCHRNGGVGSKRVPNYDDRFFSNFLPLRSIGRKVLGLAMVMDFGRVAARNQFIGQGVQTGRENIGQSLQ